MSHLYTDLLLLLPRALPLLGRACKGCVKYAVINVKLFNFHTFTYIYRHTRFILEKIIRHATNDYFHYQ